MAIEGVSLSTKKMFMYIGKYCNLLNPKFLDSTICTNIVHTDPGALIRLQWLQFCLHRLHRKFYYNMTLYKILIFHLASEILGTLQ